MVERCNVSEQEQGDSFDNGVDWAAFGELRTRCDDVRESWSTDADIYEACETGVYHLAGGCVVTDSDLEADAARFQDGECTGEWRNV